MRHVEQENAEDAQAKLEILQAAIDALEKNPRGVKFSELSKILDDWFGEPRKRGQPPDL